MAEISARVIAVDWSGAKSRAHRIIWLAEARGDQLVRLENGRTREQLVSHLIELAARDKRIVVGLDFAFSMPEWYLKTQGVECGPDFWEVVAERGEEWLKACDWPFWGAPGSKKPADIEELYRRTEKQHPGAFSTFQIGGAGAVGTGSIRGMPLLRDFRRAGWKVWPFDPPGFPLVVEIYPRLFTGPVVKSSAAERLAYLRFRFPAKDPRTVERAAVSEDAFDAAVSALVMAEQRDILRALPEPTDDVDRIEGRIWDFSDTPLEARAGCFPFSLRRYVLGGS